MGVSVPANAVSTVVHPMGMPPHPILVGNALAGMTEGAQKNMAAIIAVLTVLRKFILAPADISGF